MSKENGLQIGLTDKQEVERMIESRQWWIFVGRDEVYEDLEAKFYPDAHEDRSFVTVFGPPPGEFAKYFDGMMVLNTELQPPSSWTFSTITAIVMAVHPCRRRARIKTSFGCCGSKRVNEDLERIANTMEYLRKTGCYPDGSRPVCILCGGRKVAGIDLFFPHDSQKFGAPQGLVRAVIFVFCRRCVDLPDRDQRAEAQLLAEARVQ